MTLEQLRVFVAAAERQHVGRAAQALNLAQSSASSAIAALEARHGAKLFNRVGRGIELTEAGTLFLAAARAVLSRADAAELLLSDLGELKRGTLMVQASQTIASYWLPRHLVAFRRAHPGIDIRLAVGNTAQVAAAVHEGVAELGFVEGAVDNPLLTRRRLARDQMVVVVGPEHEWPSLGGAPADGAARKKLDADWIARADWVLREPGSGTRAVFEEALKGFGLHAGDLRVALELPSNEAVRAAVEAGLGATAISASVVAPSLETELLRRVPIDLPERCFHVLHHSERYQSHAADALIALIEGRTSGDRGDLRSAIPMPSATPFGPHQAISEKNARWNH